MFNQPYVEKIDLFPPAYVPAPFVSHETWIRINRTALTP